MWETVFALEVTVPTTTLRAAARQEDQVPHDGPSIGRSSETTSESDGHYRSLVTVTGRKGLCCHSSAGV